MWSALRRCLGVYDDLSPRGISASRKRCGRRGRHRPCRCLRPEGLLLAPRAVSNRIRTPSRAEMLPALKAATAGHHARVEALMPSLDELATPEGYAAALRALHAFHAAWEPAVWAAPGLAAT